MGIHHRLSGWGLVSAQIAVGWLAHRHYRALPALGRATHEQGRTVSIIVPARNERERLPALLRSLQHLAYRDREVLVVDDGSTDGTSAIAEALGARVVRISGPEPGWTGKSFACWTGAQEARGDWLLFTDADTRHGAQSLGRALALAQKSRAGLVSLLAGQICETFWERLLLPYAYALYFVGARRVNQPGGPAVANGQYMLFRRETYRRVGGHSAVRDSLIEDVALARVASHHGERVVLARGESDVSVRMYDSLSSLWEGFGKNAVRFVSASPRTGLPTVLGGLVWSGGVLLAPRQKSRTCALALVLAPVAGMLPWERSFGVPRRYALLQPLAAAMFQLLALDSMRRAATRSTTWKGRRY